ncbi:tRNA isopentenyltransferase [Pisolithus tinctorius]|nr:tRNA isopentenyltransferase [Pisolithus tinctorius]
MATSLQPLVVICGATGVGKSKLGVQLALGLANQGRNRWRGARIISADSMQVYKGMDVATNKISPAERMGIDHLLMDFKRPEEQYLVGEWVHDAMQAIKETHDRNEIPIVVGGSSWIQYLLFQNRLADDFPPNLSRAQHPATFPGHVASVASQPGAALLLYKFLQLLDELQGARWHWRDTPRVLRSLQIIKEQRRILSEFINEHAPTPLVLRYPTLCFWLHAEQSVLDRRLDERVDDMIKNGLVQEIRELYEYSRSCADLDPGRNGHGRSETAADFTVGLFQCIGYREFYDYVVDPNPSQKKFACAVEQMKQSTRQYARNQVVLSRDRVLSPIHTLAAESRGRPLVAALHSLDTTALESWASNVLQPAQMIMNEFLKPGETQALLVNVNKGSSPSAVFEARRNVLRLDVHKDHSREPCGGSPEDWTAPTSSIWERGGGSPSGG